MVARSLRPSVSPDCFLFFVAVGEQRWGPAHEPPASAWLDVGEAILARSSASQAPRRLLGISDNVRGCKRLFWPHSEYRECFWRWKEKWKGEKKAEPDFGKEGKKEGGLNQTSTAGRPRSRAGDQDCRRPEQDGWNSLWMAPSDSREGLHRDKVCYRRYMLALSAEKGSMSASTTGHAPCVPGGHTVSISGCGGHA